MWQTLSITAEVQPFCVRNTTSIPVQRVAEAEHNGWAGKEMGIQCSRRSAEAQQHIPLLKCFMKLNGVRICMCVSVCVNSTASPRLKRWTHPASPTLVIIIIAVNKSMRLQNIYAYVKLWRCLYLPNKCF